jgi:predicted murein hydrolase (TIGR00659 family)
MALLIAAGWLALTIGIYALARRAYARTRFVLLNPALVSIVAVMLILLATHTPYAEYDRGGHLLTLLLGPAVVALGVPLVQQVHEIRRHARAILVGIVAGSITGIVTAAGLAMLLGAPTDVVRSLVPRSVTTPIAMAIASRIGGIPSLSALVSIATGVIGGAIGPSLLRAIGVRSRLATGLALGAAAHGLGTARAVEEGAVEGAASGMAMGLNGLVTALIVPAIVAVLVLLGR